MLALLSAVAIAALLTARPPNPAHPAEAPAAALAPITLESLLAEMLDRDALARFPDPPYTCRQSSSYDRQSTTPSDPETWFGNNDAGNFIRTEKHAAATGGEARTEYVMLDTDGPGAVVRIWSANPKGTLRVYLDHAENPLIEAPMAEVLGGKWKAGDAALGEPLAGVQGRGYNLYLPVPYAGHCTITSDQGGFYYQVDCRTYPPGSSVVTLTPPSLRGGVAAIHRATQTLLFDGAFAKPVILRHQELKSQPGYTRTNFGTGFGPDCHEQLVLKPASGHEGPRAIRRVEFSTRDRRDLADVLRSVVLRITCDGELCVWAPVSDFFGTGVGSTNVQDWYRHVYHGDGIRWAAGGKDLGDINLCADFVMPYRESCEVAFVSLSDAKLEVNLGVETSDWSWDSRSMHFHAAWHAEYPIHTLAGRGTRDWNYVTIQGKGVYVGDSLAVMNPVPQWWGEGDEKIYVDGESFPSTFGTGTEDYYGFAWCDPHVFNHPFHAQPRCDGNGKNNWGHTTVSRVRALDAIPFTSSLKFDMEIWHWAEADVAYAATTYWYALPGASCNVKPDPERAGGPIPRPPPLPPPFRITGENGAPVIECESMTVLSKTPGLTVIPQDMAGFAQRTWSDDTHLWIQARKPGDFVELTFKPSAAANPTAAPQTKSPAAYHLSLYATKSWDYGIVRFIVNGHPAGPDAAARASGIDLYSGQHGKAASSGPIDLGTFAPDASSAFTLRAEVVGGNLKAEGTRAFFGLDCITATPAAKP